MNHAAESLKLNESGKDGAFLHARVVFGFVKVTSEGHQSLLSYKQVLRMLFQNMLEFDDYFGDGWV